jgi:hypothetical protein
MTQPNYGFYFERAGRSATQGAIAPAEQFFEGSIAEVSLARETGQNSLDVPAGDAPVVMRFELATVSTNDIPGIDGLREHIDRVEFETRGSQGHERMLVAKETSGREAIPVLRISDYNTKGLTGSESRNSNQSPLSALTRGAGISANDGTRGGSFGIGSAVGPMASAMCTVLYTSMPIGGQDVVFAGYSRLASHRDEDGEWRQGEGFFTDLDYSDDFRYLRNPSPLAPFAPRIEPGTDIYVLGYRKADDDPGLRHIRDAFVTHFLMAIHRGRLIVEGVGTDGEWRLDADTLKDHVKEVPEASVFYRAIQDPNPVTRVSPRFGQMSLYIEVDETLEKTLHTITMRKPLMKIDTFKHTSVPAKYAAVLECSDDKGNQLLRELEPPQHDRWDGGRAVDGDKALLELKKFVREGLKSRVKEQIGDTVEIKGLSRYLPADGLTIEKDGAGRRPSPGEGTGTEGSTVQGAPHDQSSLKPTVRRAVKVGVQTPANADGDEETSKGRDQGGEGTRKGGGHGLPGQGSEGGGKARIRAGELRFRSWWDPKAGVVRAALTPDTDVAGDLELIALGPGGSPEPDYTLPISGASLVNEQGPVEVAWDGNVLNDVVLKAGVTSQLHLALSADHRYRLAVR